MKKRADSAFGIHFDFHALPADTVADIYRPELIGELLDRLMPDYVQFDTKGHAGISSYPTKIGKRADIILHDMLMLWREETRKRDIALYGHHSGLYDMHIAKTHPEWAVVDENGAVSTEYLSVFSPYVDKILIPQLKELADAYSLDGAWIDGDCWALRADYSSWAKDAHFKETGKMHLPKSGEEGYDEFINFNCRGFKAYVSHYIREIKKEFPGFQITSNWIFSEFMPERVSVPVDFLSGDYSSFDSVNSARHEGRLLAAQNIPWDLMSWGQNTKRVDWREVNRQNKEPIQLMQEASVSIALGGGYEFFNIVYGHGGLIQQWCLEGWGMVADFVRARESICFKSKLSDEIGVVYPRKFKTEYFDGIYVANKDADNVLLSMQDAQMSTQFVLEEQTERFSKFKLLVLPSAEKLNISTKEALKQYVYNGGKLIVDLPSIQWFTEIFKPEGVIKNRLVYIDGDGRLAAAETDTVFVADTEALQMYDNNYYEANHYAAYKIVPYGKGEFLFNLFDLGNAYDSNNSAPLKRYIKALVKASGYKPNVRLLNSQFVDMTVAEKDGKLLVNLINMCGGHNINGVRSFDEIPPIYHLQLEIDFERKPSAICVYPEKLLPQYSYDGKTIRMTVDRLDIHSVIVIE